MNDINLVDQCAIRVQIYDKIKYIRFSKEDVLNWDIFIRTGEYVSIEENITQILLKSHDLIKHFSTDFISN